MGKLDERFLNALCKAYANKHVDKFLDEYPDYQGTVDKVIEDLAEGFKQRLLNGSMVIDMSSDGEAVRIINAPKQ
jgi:hypothetical protein